MLKEIQKEDEHARPCASSSSAPDIITPETIEKPPEEQETDPEAIRRKIELKNTVLDYVKSHAILNYNMAYITEKYADKDGGIDSRASDAYMSITSNIASLIARKSHKQGLKITDILTGNNISQIWEQTDVYRYYYGSGKH